MYLSNVAVKLKSEFKLDNNDNPIKFCIVISNECFNVRLLLLLAIILTIELLLLIIVLIL